MILNMPEGYSKIEKVKDPIHSLLISKNFLSGRYKWTTLVTNYDRNQDRRYFMSTLLSTAQDVSTDLKEQQSHAIAKRIVLMREDEDPSGGGGIAIREFSAEEQLEFLREIIHDMRNPYSETMQDFLKTELERIQNDHYYNNGGRTK